MRTFLSKITQLTPVAAGLAAGLIAVGVVSVVAGNYTHSVVRTELAPQQIFFPKPAEYAVLKPYAGQQVLTGSQAQIFANDIIGVDTKEISGGKTYAQLSNASLNDPSNTGLANQVELVFRGDTLRGLLLNAYAFGFMGQIALYGAIAAFFLALIMLLLVLLGIRHYRQIDPEASI